MYLNYNAFEAMKNRFPLNTIDYKKQISTSPELTRNIQKYPDFLIDSESYSQISFFKNTEVLKQKQSAD